MDTMTAPDSYRVVVMDRISELLRWRIWYRDNRWADWSVERQAHMAELRSLVRLARQARKVEADPLTLAKGYGDWTTGELVAGFGK